MFQILQLRELSKQYGSKVLFDQAEAFVGQRSRVALIGPNGSGKSTLIRMIMGEEHPDSGLVIQTKHVSVGYLPQEIERPGQRTVMDEVLRMDGRREELLVAKSELELALSTPDGGTGDEGAKRLERYGRLLEELDHLDQYRLESRAKEILAGIGFKEKDYHRPLSELSGGWVMRAALARLLLIDPDLLLLDEPTNHLDLESLLWLEEFLQRYQGALLVISHDRAFLNRMVTEVWEIDQRRLNLYKGNLDAYVVQKEERLRVLRGQYDNQQAKIAEMEAFVERFRAKATKARQAQSRLKMLEKIERIEMPDERQNVRFRFPPAPHSGKEVVTMRRAWFGYGAGTPIDRPIFQDLDFVLQRGSRVAIVGPNGVGKTTLLRLLSGSMPASSGEVRLGHMVKPGYYAQIQAESLNPARTVVEELERVAPDMPVSRVRAIAGAFLFTGDAVEKKCSVLSGGEKARVALAKLLLSPSNFLLLDEPTNHLDADSREVLLEALQDYEGTLCLISHDRTFMSPLVDSVLEIVDGQVIQLPGSYDDYLARKTREAAQSLRESSSRTEAGADPDRSDPSARRKTGPSNNQVRAWGKEREVLETEIAGLEKSQAEVSALLSDQATYDDKPRALELIAKQKTIEESLNAKLRRWEEVCLLLGL